MESMTLTGLERLLEVCQRLDLGLSTSPPAREPLKAGSLLEGVPFDPVLASVYARLGHAAFATKVMGWVLTRSDDQVHGLEEDNKWWRENLGERLGTTVVSSLPGLRGAFAVVAELGNGLVPTSPEAPCKGESARGLP